FRIDLALEWGLIAFVLNYIPFLGPLVATVFPTIFTAAQFESWQSALIMFLGLNLIQFVIGSFLEPRIAGARLSISPFLVLFSVFFWAFLWGIPGAFIGVPILIAVVSAMQHFPATGARRRRAEAFPYPVDRAVENDHGVLGDGNGCLRIRSIVRSQKACPAGPDGNGGRIHGRVRNFFATAHIRTSDRAVRSDHR